MLPMEGLIYGPSSSVLPHLSIATWMILYCVILGLSKSRLVVLQWAEHVTFGYFYSGYFAGKGTILQTPLCSSATWYSGIVSKGSIKPWCVCKQNDLWGTHQHICCHCSPLHVHAWRALPWKGSRSLNALVWGSQNWVSTRFTKPYCLTCRVLSLLLSAGIDTIPKYRYMSLPVCQ